MGGVICVGNINEAVIHVSLCYTHRFCVKTTDSQISQIRIFTHHLRDSKNR